MWDLLDSLIQSAENENNKEQNQQQPAQPTQTSQPAQPVQTTGTETSSTNQWWTQKPWDKKPQIVQNKVKRWSRISAKWFLIGCWMFILIFMLIISFSIYYLISSPTLLKSIWLDIETARSLLLTFVVIFFWFLFFISFIILILNWYRLNSVKEWKAKYVWWLVMWVILLIFSIGFGTISIMQINKLSWKSVIQTNNMVNLFLQTKDSPILLPEQIVPVVPAYVRFDLNKELFRSQILSKLSADSKLSSLEVDCWNWQTLSAWPQIVSVQDSSFWECLFLEKKDYPLNLTYKYFKSWQEYEEKVSFWNVNVASEIKIKVVWSSYSLNDNKSEILVWNWPARVLFDSNKVFTDLSLSKNRIEWDFDWDAKIDEKDKSRPQHTYEDPQLYNVFFKLPLLAGYEDTYFGFKIRVWESESSAWCKLSVNPKFDSVFTVVTELEDSSEVNSYSYKLISVDSDKIIDKSTTPQPQVDFTITDWWSYKFAVEYLTKDWKKWNCQSTPFDTKYSNYKVEYGVYGKPTVSDEYQMISTASWSETYNVPKYPYLVKLDISNITPMDDKDKITFYVDDKEVLPEDSSKSSYEFKVDQEKDYVWKIEVKADEKIKFTKEIVFSVKNKPLVAILNVKPNIGKDPLEVELDASSSKVNEQDDQIVYFTWNFWDWQVYKKVTQGKVSHTYRFDNAKADWTYEAQVTVTTKNWHEETVSQKITVQREVKEATIVVEPPHSNQISKTLETVDFSADIDWNIKSIVWDFGNGKTISWDWREYTKVSTVYDSVGVYEVKLIVTYEDQPASTSNIKIKVIE